MKTQKKLALILAALMLAANFASCAKKNAVPDTPDKKDSEVVDVVDDKKTDNKKTDDTKADDKKTDDKSDDSKPSDSTDVNKPDDAKSDDKKPDDKKAQTDDTKTDDTNKNSGKDTPAPRPEPQPTPEPQPETTINVAAIEKTIADAVGADNYLCNTDIEENWLKNYYGFDMSKIEEFIAKQNAISSVNLDTVLVLKVSDDYVDTAVELLNQSYDQTVGYIRQYAFGVSKVLNARIYKEGNYVMFILAGASYDGEDAEEEEKLAVSEYAKIDAALAKLFGSTPVNLAVVPEDNVNNGGFNGGLLIDEDMDDDIPMLGGN